ncbi:hypothetical protein VTL71DRAFT_934 [Oculimacula yallundae]|uniref:Uncharacterized protein n=1 Tax=Oculimacula yallundae TaxID=86028 RepID=A0ABR4D3Q9_9HELO
MAIFFDTTDSDSFVHIQTLFSPAIGMAQVRRNLNRGGIVLRQDSHSTLRPSRTGDSLRSQPHSNVPINSAPNAAELELAPSNSSKR